MKHLFLSIGGTAALFFIGVPLSILLMHSVVGFDYTLAVVAVGGAALGAISGVLGAFAVQREQSLMGDALSHAALPGVAAAFLLAGRELGWLLLGAAAASWLAVLFVRAVTTTTRIKQDAAMGITLAAFFAFGLALLAYIQGRPDASQAGLNRFIFGQAAAIRQNDLSLIALIGFSAFTIIALFWKEFKIITFDRDFARANGFPVVALDLLLSTLIVAAIVLGLQLAGVILMVGLLIAPAAAARQWTHNLMRLVFLAGLFGAAAGASGAVLSAVGQGLPTGPLIIVIASGFVFFSLAFAPGRGLVWRWWQRRDNRRRFARRPSSAAIPIITDEQQRN